MIVYVVIEYTGTEAACDGAVIHGVTDDRDGAYNAADDIARTESVPRTWIKIEAHEVGAFWDWEPA